jgi:hypothetical protein
MRSAFTNPRAESVPSREKTSIAMNRLFSQFGVVGSDFDSSAYPPPCAARPVTSPIAAATRERVMAFRFVHTADTRLDSPLRTLAPRGPAPAGSIGEAMRRRIHLPVQFVPVMFES